MRLILTQPQLSAFDNAHSLETFRRILDGVPGGLSHDDIVLLPEHAFFVETKAEYLDIVAPLAREHGCHLVAGSFHEIGENAKRNTGAVLTPEGEVLGWFDKLRPYSDERSRVDAGTRLGEFRIGELNVLVTICADFWFSDLFFQAKALPDLVLVPALSVTRKSTPDYSRALWRNLAISRAYEFGVLAGISDWGFPSQLPKHITSGVGGFADTTGMEPAAFFRATGDAELQIIEPDFAALALFRHDRHERGFYWKK
ncbi:MAG: carbon-nitrogen hydrolase family protein [Bacteroidetes bacterium]|nr:carbon-nitrogen hydrolase family protein [Bacteroidota bacterium]